MSTRDSVANLMVGVDLDSPIEAMFLEALWRVSPCSMRIRSITGTAFCGWASFGLIEIRAQKPVGRYVTDFELRHSHHEGVVYVECDGHEFHERTPEQAEHDRARDRFFTAEGLKVLRFTGRELNRNASKCAREALALLMALPAKVRQLECVTREATP